MEDNEPDPETELDAFTVVLRKGVTEAEMLTEPVAAGQDVAVAVTEAQPEAEGEGVALSED